MAGAAFFDLDRTLLARSSSLALAPAFRKGGLIGRRDVVKATVAQLVFVRFGAGHGRTGRTAESAMKRRPLLSASRRASVVLPVPGAPQRIKDGSAPPPASSRRRIRPSPTRCVWPTNSASERGRMRSARGTPSAGGAAVSGVFSPKRLGEFQRSIGQNGCIIIAEKN